MDLDKVTLMTEVDSLRRGWQACEARLATVEAERDAAQAGEARAVEALEKILVGGNHLASALTGMFEDRLPPYGTDFNEARRAFAGSDEYDLWVCWAVIMRVRDSLSDPQPALDWLTQQRAEAAVEELKKLGPLGSSNQELFMVPWGEIRQRIQELEAGAEGAGATESKESV